MLKKRFMAALCAISMFTGSVYAANISDFSDVNGHWAYDTLSNAIADGYLNGSNGKLNPDGSLTAAQMAVILNRVLHTSDTSRVYPNILQNEWYSKDANIAVSAGFLPVDGSLNINNNVTRGEVFKVLVNAFGLAEANPSIEPVKKFSDWNEMTLDERRAAAVLIDNGILSGSNTGKLNPNSNISRAEFMTLVYRIIDGDLVKIYAPWKKEETTEGNEDTSTETEQETQNSQDVSTEQTTEQTQNSQETSTEQATQQTQSSQDVSAEQVAEQTQSSQDVSAEQTTEETQVDEEAETTDTPVSSDEEQTENSENQDTEQIAKFLMFVDSDISALNKDETYNTVILSGKVPEIVESYWDKIEMERLVINTTGADVELDNTIALKANTIVVGSGNGAVTLNGQITKNFEITGSGRTIILNDAKLDNLIISGTNNKIIINENSNIENLTVQVCATNNSFTIDGNVVNANLNGNKTTVDGSGRITNTIVKGSYCSVAPIYENYDDSGVDNGLNGVKININAPTVEAGGDLAATATISGVTQEKIISAQWYYEGVADSKFGNSNFQLSEGKTSTYRKDIVFEKYMDLSRTVKFTLSYKNTVTEQVETVSAQADVTIVNYPASHYLPDASEVLAKVHPYYYSGNTDYTQGEKIVFVNAKGYSSKTQYLIWVSRSAQMVNVFEGSQWNWKLIHEFQCATGKSSSPTPIGVTEVTYKQTGWYTSSYTCRPVVRFYPGTGYAFHSRLYYPGTNKLKDPSIGFPVSAGCVRMLDEGIYWLYNNIPSGTTVVIY